jgi:hypothetical protein
MSMQTDREAPYLTELPPLVVDLLCQDLVFYRTDFVI